jgi:hypothetical protein
VLVETELHPQVAPGNLDAVLTRTRRPLAPLRASPALAATEAFRPKPPTPASAAGRRSRCTGGDPRPFAARAGRHLIPRKESSRTGSRASCLRCPQRRGSIRRQLPAQHGNTKATSRSRRLKAVDTLRAPEEQAPRGAVPARCFAAKGRVRCRQRRPGDAIRPEVCTTPAAARGRIAQAGFRSRRRRASLAGTCEWPAGILCGCLLRGRKNADPVPLRCSPSTYCHRHSHLLGRASSLRAGLARTHARRLPLRARRGRVGRRPDAVRQRQGLRRGRRRGSR